MDIIEEKKTTKIYIHLYNLSLTDAILRLNEKNKINMWRKNNRSILLLFSTPVNVVSQFGSLVSSSAVNSAMRGKFRSSYQKWGFWFHLTSKGWNRISATGYVGACFELLRKNALFEHLTHEGFDMLSYHQLLAHRNLFPTSSSITSTPMQIEID